MEGNGLEPANMEFRERQKILASDGKAWAHFGSGVSVSGDHMVIGAVKDSDDGYYAGAAYIYERNTNGLWVEKQKISGHDTKTMSNFGSAVSVSGNTMIVGARDDAYGENAGAAYIFENNGTSWEEVVKLNASDAAGGDDFASIVSLSDSHAVIATIKSKAYIFEKTTTGWREAAKLLPPDESSTDGFGRNVSISGNTVVVGAASAYQSEEKSGAVFIYNKTSTGWTLVTTLTAPNGIYTFGRALQIDGNQMIVGAGKAVYIYEKTISGWQQLSKILSTDVDDSNTYFYGYNNVSISDKYAVVGDYSDSEKDYRAGAAYIFEKSSQGWARKSKVLASDGSFYDHFGITVAVDSGDVVITSSFNNEKGREAGAAYGFELSELPADLSIDRFSLIDASTDQIIPGFEDMKDGAIINLAELTVNRDELNIDAVTYPEKVGSVRLELTGTKNTFITQNLAPYAIFSDTNGDYLPGSLPEGTYTLTAIPYSESKRAGEEGKSKTIHFTVIDEEPALAVTSFYLINADTDERLVHIRDGEEVNLHYFSNAEFDIETSNFNIEATTTVENVGSVELEVYYKGSLLIKTIDNTAPYAFFGDVGGDFNKWQPGLGTFRIRATPYSGANKSGEKGQILEIDFNIVNESIAVPRFAVTDKKKGSSMLKEADLAVDPTVKPLPFTLYPNPAASSLRVEYVGEEEETLVLSIYNAAGQLLTQRTGQGFLQETFDVSRHEGGVYLAVLLHKGQKIMQKFIIRK